MQCLGVCLRGLMKATINLPVRTVDIPVENSKKALPEVRIFTFRTSSILCTFCSIVTNAEGPHDWRYTSSNTCQLEQYCLWNWRLINWYNLRTAIKETTDAAFKSCRSKSLRNVSKFLPIWWAVSYPITDMSRLTTRIRSEKLVDRRFRRCANVIECTYTNLDSTV